MRLWERFSFLNYRSEKVIGFRVNVSRADACILHACLNIYENEHTITLKLDVPGIEEKEIDVRIQDNTLTVHGERKIEKEEKEENYRRVERQYGSFTRSFTLPSSVDTGQVNAHYDNGVLKISLAKKAEAKPKQIKVNLGGEKTLEAKAQRKAA